MSKYSVRSRSSIGKATGICSGVTLACSRYAPDCLHMTTRLTSETPSQERKQERSLKEFSFTGIVYR
jgi:hypothetical protein